MILLIDNYDSFTYNLYQYIREINNEEVQIVRNDETDLHTLLNRNPSYIIISPGPGRPENAGIIVDLIREAAGKIPILGVCLGLQAIAVAFGMELKQAQQIIHGKTDKIDHDGKGIFRSIHSPTICTRYHSLAVKRETVSNEFEISATGSNKEIMGLRHKQHIIEGVQFHPESIASSDGKKLLRNFFQYRRKPFPVQETLSKILRGSSLNIEESQCWMEEVTSGNISPILLSAFLTAFNMKKINAQELAGAAAALCKNARPITIDGKLLDTCGTGGDGKKTFNISSITALMAASCGARVAKHGNRAISSRCGSADFYQALGIPLDLSSADAVSLLEQTDFTFLFAPHYHPSMRHAAAVRRELGVKTIMNLLGPLTNPAHASHRLVGVYDSSVTDTMAKAARLQRVKRALFFSTEDGQDEISVIAPTQGYLLFPDGEIETVHIDPKRYRMPEYSIKNLAGADASENAREAWNIAKGKGRNAIRDAMLLNTACALFIYEAHPSVQEGLEAAQEALASGKLRTKMEEIIDTAKTLQKKNQSQEDSPMALSND